MGRNSLRLRRRRVARIATALGLSAATVPVVLGALAQPSAAASSSANSATSAQQVVADAECDIAWLDWDVAVFEGAPGRFTPPTCTPVPAAFQEAVTNSECDISWLVWDAGDLFGFGVPAPSPFCEPVPPGLAGFSL